MVYDKFFMENATESYRLAEEKTRGQIGEKRVGLARTRTQGGENSSWNINGGIFDRWDRTKVRDTERGGKSL